MKDISRIKYVIILLSLSIFTIFTIPNAQGATITAASCSLTAVQSAVNSTVSGDTVVIPSGSCTWSGGITLSKGISVVGAGDSTVLTANQYFIINGPGSGNFRISNMRFSSTSAGGPDITVNGAWTSVRIDHITWNTGSTRPIQIGYNIYGDIVFRGLSRPHEKVLIDNITYTQRTSTAGRPFVLIYGRGGDAWLEDDGFGTDNFVFIEDSTFNYVSTSGYVTDTERGGRYVFRYNTVTNAGVSMHDFGSTSYSRGNRATEQYNNTLTCSISGCSSRPALQPTRGGTGLFYNNTITGYGMYSWPMIWRVAYPYFDSSQTPYIGYGCQQSETRKMCQDGTKHCSGGTRNKRPCYDDSNCPGGSCPSSYLCTSNSDCLDADGNTGLCMQIDGLGRTGSEATGWPCRDQAGRGKDDPSAGQQASSPVYWWNNTVNGVSNKSMSVGEQYSQYIQQNRDYCNSSPATSCGSKAAWTYKPYPYPHPLQKGEIPPPDTGIKPPGNFRIAK